jgi:cytochrome c peroxidase
MKKKSFFFGLLGITFTLIAGTIDLGFLFNYTNQNIPSYITQDNTFQNPITDAGATLGRVLFYDKNISSDNSTACASCHQQEFAFGDTSSVSQGVNGFTKRHSMRIINPRFQPQSTYFWDVRADSLEALATMPIKDHIEMGFSGTDGAPSFNDLLLKLDTIDYYNHLFNTAYGDTIITEHRIQKALAQFMRSIQSFDSKYDTGFAIINNSFGDFPNFSLEENHGKSLFLSNECNTCHVAPEFHTDTNHFNNGVITVFGLPGAIDTSVSRSATLRDLMNPNGQPNGPMMHDGSFRTLMEVIDHYDSIPDDPANTNLSPFLNNFGAPGTQELNLTLSEKNAIIAFLKTLTGNNVYSNPIWSTPFDSQGNLTLINSSLSVSTTPNVHPLKLYPNPASSSFTIQTNKKKLLITILSSKGEQINQLQSNLSSFTKINISTYPEGIYFVTIKDQETSTVQKKRLVITH